MKKTRPLIPHKKTKKNLRKTLERSQSRLNRKTKRISNQWNLTNQRQNPRWKTNRKRQIRKLVLTNRKHLKPKNPRRK